jgi:hypothetical protein
LHRVQHILNDQRDLLNFSLEPLAFSISPTTPRVFRNFFGENWHCVIQLQQGRGGNKKFAKRTQPLLGAVAICVSLRSSASKLLDLLSRGLPSLQFYGETGAAVGVLGG